MTKGMTGLMIVLLISFGVAYFWDHIPIIKESVEYVLNPTLGYLLRWNVYVGFIILVALISLILTLLHKYLTDQNALKELKKEQKYLQEEMKKYKDHPEKLLEFQKKQLEFIPKTLELTIKPLIYTSIPIILLFRWFGDFLNPVFGGWWILYYLIGAMIFSGIFKKVFKVE